MRRAGRLIQLKPSAFFLLHSRMLTRPVSRRQCHGGTLEVSPIRPGQATDWERSVLDKIWNRGTIPERLDEQVVATESLVRGPCLDCFRA